MRQRRIRLPLQCDCPLSPTKIRLIGGIQVVSILFFCRPVPYHWRGSNSPILLACIEEQGRATPVNQAPLLLRGLWKFSCENMERLVAPARH